MKNVIHAPEKLCPCGSDREIKDCCLPDDYPISRRNLGFERLDLRAEGVDQWGRAAVLPPGLVTEVTLYNPSQLDETIEKLVESLDQSVVTIALHEVVLRDIGDGLQNLRDSLYAVRFHQHQCLRRLSTLYTDHLLLFRRPTGNVKVHIDDMPFRFELEAFIIRARTTLDVLSRIGLICLGRKPDKFGKFQNIVRSTTGPLRSPYREGLINLLDRHDPWIKEIRTLRDALAHEGDFTGFQALGYEKGRLLDPKVTSVPADHLCFRVWAGLQEILAGTIDVLVQSSRR